jgi:hypothetical protein
MAGGGIEIVGEGLVPAIQTGDHAGYPCKR